MSDPDLKKLSPLRTTAWQTLLIAILAACAFSILHILDSPNLSNIGSLRSTDDMVRMVMVRDWMNGQSWYDPYLYRLGLEPGTLMHWSRLIDAPIAVLILIGNWFKMGSGEFFAAMAWPFLTFVAAIAGLLTAVRRATGSNNMLPSLIIGGFALSMSAVFNNGVIDHHNAQLALTMWLFALLLPTPSINRDYPIAALMIALMMAIGMEALPIIAAAVCMVFFYLLSPNEALLDALCRFGLTLAISTGALFLGLTATASYSAGYCDSFSSFHLVCAVVGGLALYIGFQPTLRSRIPSAHLAVPFIGAGLVAIAVGLFFPYCLGDPLGELDPLVVKFWLNGVTEAQGFAAIARIDPWLLPFTLVLPVLAVIASLILIAKDRSDKVAQSLFMFVLIMLGVTSVQFRGAQFATPLAALALSIYVTRFSERAGKEQQLLLLGAMVVSCTLFWKMITVGAMALLADGKPGPLMSGGQVSGANDCANEKSLAALNAQPVGTIAAANNFGPTILYKTNHRALSGPYHRNNDGNLTWIKAMIGNEDEAKKILQVSKVALLAICPADPDAIDFIAAAPQGFMAGLLAGKTPDWLEPVANTMDKPLKLWRVKPL